MVVQHWAARDGSWGYGVVTLFHDTLQKGSSLSGEYQWILSGTRTPKAEQQGLALGLWHSVLPPRKDAGRLRTW